MISGIPEIVGEVGIVTALAVPIALLVLRVAGKWLLKPALGGLIEMHFNIKYEKYRRDLETEHEAAIAAVAQLRNAASMAFSEAQRVAAQRRIQAVENVWAGTLEVKQKRHAVIGMIDLFTPRQVQDLVDLGAFQPLTETVDVDTASRLLLDNKVEPERPFIGEKCYSLYYCYRGISSQAAFIIKAGVDAGEMSPWFYNDDIRSLLLATMDSDEIQKFDTLTSGKMRWYTDLIEQKILVEMNKVISGEMSTNEGILFAARIYPHVKLEGSEVQIDGPNGMKGAE